MSKRARNFVERPLPERLGPNRSAANLYRAAVDDPSAIGGVPIDSVEDAAVAAVRLGYRIAEAQIDRTARLGRRLRKAADEATGVDRAKGESSEEKTLDATEQLVFKTLMAGLSWFEGISADPANPLKRLATAQFRLLGSMFGLLPAEPDTARGSRTREHVSRADDGPELAAGADTTVRTAPPARQPPQISHSRRGEKTAGRPVRIREWELTTKALGDYPLTFYGARSADRFPGVLTVTRSGAAMLKVTTSGTTATGIYKAAVCDTQGVQIGYIEIVL